MEELRRFNATDDMKVHRAVHGKYVLHKEAEQQITELKEDIKEVISIAKSPVMSEDTKTLQLEIILNKH